MRFRPFATACVLAGISLLLYAFRISAPPPSPAEIVFNRAAQSIAASNTPLFFHEGGERWVQPVAVYANAAMRAVGGEQLSGRLVSAIAAAISVALVFLIAQQIAGVTWVSMLAALMLMLTPAFWSAAQLGTDAMMPVPLILLWLFHTLRFFERDSLRSLAAGACFLGLSAFSHPAAPLTAVFLWLLMLVVGRRRNLTRLFIATAVFGAMWVPALLWFLSHPDSYPDTFGRWFVFAAHLRNPLEGLRAFFNTGTLGNRASLYWGFWDPSWLFFDAPQTKAPLLLIAAPLIVAGVIRCTRHLAGADATLLIGLALIAPLAGATFGSPHYLLDAAAVMPAIALLSALGADQVFRLLMRRPLRDYKIEDEVRDYDDGRDA